jgi:peptidoglycan hydrolase CwlO-like protein
MVIRRIILSQENDNTRRSRSRQTEDVMIKESTSKSVAIADPMANILSTLMSCDSAQLRMIFDTTIKEHNQRVLNEKEAYNKEIEAADAVSAKAQSKIDDLYKQIEDLTEVIHKQKERQEQADSDHAINMGSLEEAQTRIRNMMALFSSQLDGFAI